MSHFFLSEEPIDSAALNRLITDHAAGASLIFEGWVRNNNDGRGVLKLDYQAYSPLALAEGERILVEALERFEITAARCMHRVGSLAIGDLAVWVGVSAAHRGCGVRCVSLHHR